MGSRGNRLYPLPRLTFRSIQCAPYVDGQAGEATRSPVVGEVVLMRLTFDLPGPVGVGRPREFEQEKKKEKKISQRRRRAYDANVLGTTTRKAKTIGVSTPPLLGQESGRSQRPLRQACGRNKWRGMLDAGSGHNWSPRVLVCCRHTLAQPDALSLGRNL